MLVPRNPEATGGDVGGRQVTHRQAGEGGNPHTIDGRPLCTAAPAAVADGDVASRSRGVVDAEGVLNACPRSDPIQCVQGSERRGVASIGHGANGKLAASGRCCTIAIPEIEPQVGNIGGTHPWQHSIADVACSTIDEHQCIGGVCVGCREEYLGIGGGGAADARQRPAGRDGVGGVSRWRCS